MSSRIRIRLVAAFTLAGLAGLAGSAAAERPPAPRDAAADAAPEVVYQARTHYDFEDDVVEGEMFHPDGSIIQSGRRAGFESLIHIRQNFVPEMLKAADDL